MNPCPDLKRQVVEARGREAVIVWLDGLVDEQRLQVGITALSGSLPPARRGTGVPQGETPGVDARSLASWQDVIRALCDGCAVCFFDGRPQAYAWDVAKRPGRGVEKAENEPTMQGSQEAFVENLGNNLALLRKRLRPASLKVEMFEVGEQAPVRVASGLLQGRVGLMVPLCRAWSGSR
jgi:hypothetical protein